MEQLFLQEKTVQALKHLRGLALQKKNKSRQPSVYQVGQFVLIHKSRWPQWKVEKISSPWFGPFRVVQVSYNSLQVLASPTLGGLVKVSFSQVKHWSSAHDPFSFSVGLGSECAGEHQESGDALITSPLVPSSVPLQVLPQERGAGDEEGNVCDAHEP